MTAAALVASLCGPNYDPAHVPLIEAAFAEVRREALEEADAACDIQAPTGSGEYGHGWIAMRETVRKAIRFLSCSTCGGTGEIGGFVGSIGSGGEGYQTDPCPDCSPAAIRSLAPEAGADPARALARLFAKILEREIVEQMVECLALGLVKESGGPDQWPLTELGRAALALGEADG